MPVIVFLVLLILHCRKCYNKNLNLFLVLADIVSSESQSFYLLALGLQKTISTNVRVRVPRSLQSFRLSLEGNLFQ